MEATYYVIAALLIFLAILVFILVRDFRRNNTSEKSRELDQRIFAIRQEYLKKVYLAKQDYLRELNK